MQVIEEHPYVDQVLAPLDGESGVGEALGDDVVLEFLENEIMKMGSLAHSDIDWPKVENEALKILSDRSKDLKVLGFLMLSLQRGGDGERFALSLFLLHRVMDSWWTSAWPYPGDRGKRARTLMFNQMLQRAGNSIEGLAFDGSVGDGRGFCLNLVDKLLSQAEALELPGNLLLELKRALERLPRVNEAGAAPERSVPSSTPTSAATESVASSSSAGLGSVTLDPGNERATRQSLLRVADLLTETEPASPLGYRLRRYAIWSSITSLPPTRDGKRTDLAAVSPDRVSDYRESLEKAPDHELWKRIELSLSVSPFWLDGHGMSALVASALGHDACADAIREDLRGFIQRLPQLPELTFNDGTPFLSNDGADWLWAAPSRVATGGGGASSWDLAYETAMELIPKKGLAAAMQVMEEGLVEAREPREQFYWRLANARLLREAGLKTLAAQQFQDLYQQVQGRALEDWEPALIKQLQRLA